VRYWEIIAGNLSKAGWSWGGVSTVDCTGRTIFVAEADRGDGQRFIVRADQKLTAFVGFGWAIRDSSVYPFGAPGEPADGPTARAK